MQAKNLLDNQYADFPVIAEQTLCTFMKHTVEPYLNTLRESTDLTGSVGNAIHSETYRNPGGTRGTVLISHGFTESTAKYHESIYYFLKSGFHVCIMDHRNHGYSRPASVLANPDSIGTTPTHIEHYTDYLEDMDLVVNQVLTTLPAPYYLFCHSMGGAIGACYIQSHPDFFSKVIFSSPMFEVNSGGAPLILGKILVNLACLFGKKEALMIGAGTFSKEPDFAHSAAVCEARYNHYFQKQLQNPAYQSAGCSNGWTREAFRMDRHLLKSRNLAAIDIPVLLFQAENDDFVAPGGQEVFMNAMKKGTFYKVPGAKHEIYLSGNDILVPYWSAIMDFLME